MRKFKNSEKNKYLLTPFYPSIPFRLCKAVSSSFGVVQLQRACQVTLIEGYLCEKDYYLYKANNNIHWVVSMFGKDIATYLISPEFRREYSLVAKQ